MKDIKMKAFSELQSATEPETVKSQLAMCPEGEVALHWEENSSIRLTDEALISSINALEKLLVLFIAKCVIVHPGLIYNMLTQQGMEIERPAVTGILNKLSKKGLLTCTVLQRSSSNAVHTLPLYSIGSRGVLLLRSLDVHFYNLRLPSFKTPEKLKSIASAAQTAYALAENIHSIQNGLTLVLKKGESVFNNVRVYTAAREDTTFVIEAVRRGPVSFDDLTEKIQRIAIALNPTYEQMRDRYFLRGKCKFIIVCEDKQHILEIAEKLRLPEELADITYFTFDASTFSPVINLYKYEKKELDISALHISENDFADAYAVLQELMNPLNDAHTVLTNILAQWNRLLMKTDNMEGAVLCQQLLRSIKNEQRKEG